MSRILGVLSTFILVLICVATLPTCFSASIPLGPCRIAFGSDCKEVTFYLVTRSNINNPQLVTADTISTSYFDPKRETKMIIHGYASGMDLSQLQNIAKEYLMLAEYNILFVQYLSLADSPCYPFAVRNIRYVGRCLASFVKSIQDHGHLQPIVAKDVINLHVLGFSLGGQTAAFLANNVRPLRLHRITGLDPAMLLFVTSDLDNKLDASDAQRVDVIHTNAYLQGKAERCGHIDFYMNGGITQPGCTIDDGILDVLNCDHHRAPEYFAESIRSSIGFWGWPCSSIADYSDGCCSAHSDGVLMGEHWDQRSEGFFIAETNSESPFAQGRWWINDTNTERESRPDKFCSRVRSDVPESSSQFSTTPRPRVTMADQF